MGGLNQDCEGYALGILDGQDGWIDYSRGARVVPGVSFPNGVPLVASTALPAVRSGHTVSILSDGRILVVGGQDSSTTRAETYFGTISGGSITWVAGTNLPAVRHSHTANILSDGRILVTGGHDGATVRAETYFGTISGNSITWVAGTSLPLVRYSHTASILPDGRILVTGGYYTLARDETYFGTISGGSITWVAGTLMPFARYEHAVSVLVAGRILVTGGHDGFTARDETYFGTISGNSITWVAGTLMPFAKYAHTVNILSDGRFMIIGGGTTAATQCIVLFGTFLTDTTIGWEVTSSEEIRNHTTIILPDNRVVIAGGINSSNQVIDNTYIGMINGNPNLQRIIITTEELRGTRATKTGLSFNAIIQSVWWSYSYGSLDGLWILGVNGEAFRIKAGPYSGQIGISWVSGIDVLLNSVTPNRWYHFELEINGVQGRARVDGGAWTPWRTSPGGRTEYTQVILGLGPGVGRCGCYWDDFGIPSTTITPPSFEVPLFVQGFPAPLPAEPFDLSLSLLPEQIIQNIEAVPFNSTITLNGACTGPPPVFYETPPMPEGGEGVGATGGGGGGGQFSLGHGFIDATQRSQEIDYGETMGKRKKPWAAKGYTFPEVQAFHQETFPVGVPGGPGGPGGPMSPVGDPCAGRVLQPLTQITIPCGEKDFPMQLTGAIGEVTIHWPEGISGTEGGGTIESCPANDFVEFFVCDECPGCSTVTIWFDKCPCGSSGITCGADVAFCGSTTLCSKALPISGTTQFASLAGGTWSLEPGGDGWSVDQTGKVTTSNACGGQKLKITGENCCGSELDINVGYSLAIDCSSPPCDQIVKSSSKAYSVTGAYGVVTWSVTGTGATINQSGTLTTDATACGMLEIQATDECGGCGSMSVRVTNGGTWCLVSTQGPTSTVPCTVPACYWDGSSYRGCGPGQPPECMLPSTYVIEGDTMTYYVGNTVCSTCTPAPVVSLGLPPGVLDPCPTFNCSNYITCCAPCGGCQKFHYVRYKEVYKWKCVC